MFVGACLFLSSPHTHDNLVVGRYFNGIGVGFSIVPFILYASELADDSCRGSVLALEQCFITVGVAIQMIYTSYWSDDLQLPANRLHGIFDALFAGLAWCSLRNFVESPNTHIYKGDDAAALESLAKLHRPATVSVETEIMLAQRKSYIEEQQSLTVTQSIVGGLVPLFKMLLFRSVVVALSNSLTLNMAFQYSMLAKSVKWVPVAAAFCRIAGSLISLFLVDKITRKMPTLIYAVSISGLCLTHSKFFYDIYDVWNLAAAKYVYMVIQLVVGLYVPYTTVYLSEAFPLKVKPYMMAICVVVEQVLQIVLICITKPLIAANLSTQGGIIFLAWGFLAFAMPDTRNTLWSEAQRRIRKLWHLW